MCEAIIRKKHEKHKRPFSIIHATHCACSHIHVCVCVCVYIYIFFSPNIGMYIYVHILVHINDRKRLLLSVQMSGQLEQQHFLHVP